MNEEKVSIKERIEEWKATQIHQAELACGAERVAAWLVGDFSADYNSPVESAWASRLETIDIILGFFDEGLDKREESVV